MSVSKEEARRRFLKLCEEAQNEKDETRLLELVRKIVSVYDAEESAKTALGPKPSNSPATEPGAASQTPLPNRD